MHCERCSREIEHKEMFKLFDPILNRDVKMCFDCRNLAKKAK